MPGLNGKGPLGMGPMTGGGRGRCNPYWGGMGYYPPYYDYGHPGYVGYGYPRYGGSYWSFGRGGRFGRGRGFGRGRSRRWWHGPYSPYGVPVRQEDDLNFLKDEMDFLRQEMEAIDTRIKELEKKEQ